MTILQKLDQMVEEQVRKLELTGKMPRLEDLLQTTDEQALKYANYGLNILAIFLPFLILLGVWFFHSGVKSEIRDRDGIISGIKEYGALKNKLSQLEQQVVSKIPLRDKGSAAKALNQVLSRGTKTSGEVNIGDFEQFDKGESILVSEGSVEFNNFSKDELSGLINKMVVGLKMKIIEVEIFKDEQSNFLKGMFRFTHYGKRQSE